MPLKINQESDTLFLCSKNKKDMTENEKKAHFLNLYSMVMADGIAHHDKMATLYRIGIENYGLSDEQIREYITDSGVSTVIPELPEDRVRGLYELAVIAWADGKLERSERDLLRRYAIKFEVEDDSVDALTDFLLDEAKQGTDIEAVINKLKE